eukprot:349961-Chlamydomonas_euryale.AAC.7
MAAARWGSRHSPHFAAPTISGNCPSLIAFAPALCSHGLAASRDVTSRSKLRLPCPPLPRQSPPFAPAAVGERRKALPGLGGVAR